MEELHTMPSNLEGTSNHLLQLPYFTDEELRSSVAMHLPKTASWRTAAMQIKAQFLFFLFSVSNGKIHHGQVQLPVAPSEGRCLFALAFLTTPFSSERYVDMGQ